MTAVHEYSIVQALIGRVEQEALRHRASAVHRVTVRIGDLAGVETGLLVSAYDLIRERTVCKDAPLVIEPVAARWECPGCGGAFERGAPLQCAGCGTPARLVQGDELLLTRIEMEVP
jgi:hydrogenase nickel incorporation protein HypA/HybF